MNLTGRYRYILPLLAILIVGTILLYFLLGNRQPAEMPLYGLPGIAEDGVEYDPEILAPGVLRQIEDSLQIDVEIKSAASDGKEEITKVEDIAASWRKLPSFDLGDDEDEIMISDQVLARDQLYLGQALVETGKSRQFNRWRDTFTEAFYDSSSGLFSSSLVIQQDGYYVRSNPDWITTQGYTRVLLQAYMLNPSRSLQNNLEDLSAVLLPIFQSGPPASITGLGPNLNHPLTFIAEDIEIEEQREIDLISVDSIDFWTLSQLAGIDGKWEEIAKQWISRVSGSMNEAGMPFPPEGWNMAENTAMPLIDSDYQADTLRILKTSLNLAEVGIINAELEGFLLEEITSGGLASSYHLVNGNGSERIVNPAMAALTARLARAADNGTLYAAAIRQLNRSYVSNQASPFFGGYGQTDCEGRQIITALDQALALLALQ